MRADTLLRAMAVAVAVNAACATGASAQIMTNGTRNEYYTYTVPGTAQGKYGPVWVIVRDTTVRGQPALRFAHRSPEEVLFESTPATAQRGTDMAVTAVLATNRKVFGSCSASDPDPKPTYTLSYVLTRAALQDGSVVSYRVYRCSFSEAGRSGAMTYDLKATVSSGTAARGQGAEEPAWMVTGGADYPFAVWIAKSDYRVLKWVRVDN